MHSESDFLQWNDSIDLSDLCILSQTSFSGMIPLIYLTCLAKEITAIVMDIAEAGLSKWNIGILMFVLHPCEAQNSPPSKHFSLLK